MTAIGTGVAHEKTVSEFHVVEILGCFLAIVCSDPDEASPNSPQTFRSWEGRCLFLQIPRNAKSVVCILKLRRNARTRRATRNLNLVPPRSSARTAPLPLRRSLRVALRRTAIIYRREPVRAPLVHVRPNVAKPVRVSFRTSHRLGPVLPAHRIVSQMLRRLVAPRKLFLLHAAARRAFPFRFRRQTISPPASRAQPLTVSHRIKP